MEAVSHHLHKTFKVRNTELPMSNAVKRTLHQAQHKHIQNIIRSEYNMVKRAERTRGDKRQTRIGKSKEEIYNTYGRMRKPAN